MTNENFFGLREFKDHFVIDLKIVYLTRLLPFGYPKNINLSSENSDTLFILKRLFMDDECD